MSNTLKKILSGVGVLAAFGLGGAAIAGAQGGKPNENPAASQPNNGQAPGREQADASEQNRPDERGESDETEQKVTGADADRAGQAALRSVPGKVLSVQKETPEQGGDNRDPGEKPETGEQPDSAREQAIDQKIAYSVEVQKADGTIVDVALDGAFNVLGTEQDAESSSEQDAESPSEQADEAPAQR